MRDLFIIFPVVEILMSYPYNPVWANNPTFLTRGPNNETPGFDPIIGQAGPDPSVRSMTGTDPQNTGQSLPLPQEWVVSKGGEYFIAPSISALQTTFASA